MSLRGSGRESISQYCLRRIGYTFSGETYGKLVLPCEPKEKRRSPATYRDLAGTPQSIAIIANELGVGKRSVSRIYERFDFDVKKIYLAYSRQIPS